MKSKPYVIKPDMTGQSLTLIAPDKKHFSERWLQELLQAHPNILPVDEIEPIFWPLVSIGREISTNVGYIDNLFISMAGYPVIVETKLWRNSEAKREVLAQAIDYGSELSTWTFEQLDNETKKHNPYGVIELIQNTFDADPDELPDEDLIAKNLRLGRFLILIVSDHIRESLIQMLNYVNRYPHLATNVGLIELQCYFLPEAEKDILVVPSLVARTEIVERSIVQVNLVPNVEHQITIEQKKADTDSEGRRALSEDAYWEILRQNSPTSIASAKQLFDHFSKYPEIMLKMRKSATVVRLTLPESGDRFSLFYIDTNGLVVCWIHTLKNQLEKAGLPVEIGNTYEKEISKFLPNRRKNFSIYSQLEKVDITGLIETVDRFITAILNFDPESQP